MVKRMLKSFKNTVRSSSAGELCISVLHCVESAVLPRLIDDEKAVSNYYRNKSGKTPDLTHPTSFSEKLNRYKLTDRNPLMPLCADKVEVRQYVASKGFEASLNGLIGVYDRVSDIDFDTLPHQFVMKAAHGSHMIFVVPDKSSFNFRKAKRLMRTWLHQDIYWPAREWVYRDLKKRIVIEDYLEDGSGGLSDYKFFCFNGEPKFVQFNCDRYSGHPIQNFYDLNWKLLHFGKSIPPSPDAVIDRPKLLAEMTAMAKSLSEPFQFVRVDLYVVNEKIYFGELTFFPAGGAPDFIPDEYDEIVGRLWELRE